jgi:protein-glucosylgalactosylhydroxylysine glucosidase
MTAMTAARLGEAKIAVDALLMSTEKNRYLQNGHNWQRENLPCYLPGNGGLLYAVAMMAGGWKGAPRMPAPGFPADGSWTVRSEKLNTALLKVI